MEDFIYVAKNEQGETIRSSVAANSRYEAISLLREQALTVIEVTNGTVGARQNTGEKRVYSQHKVRAMFSRVRLSDMAMFCRQLSITINAGVPLRDSLETIAADIDHPALCRTIHRLIDMLHDGKTFSQAMAQQHNVFNSLLVSLIAAAEESGSLPQTLHQIATYLERSDRLARKIISITAYPIFVAVFFGIVCIIMTLFVLPQFQHMFAGFKAQLPALTRIVFGINQFILNHLALLTVAVGGLVILFSWYRRTPTGRRQLDAFKLKVPLIGPCLRKFIMARVCRNLAVMVRGGVPVTTALEIISKVSDNHVVEHSVLAVRERVIAGADIAASLAADKEFPRLVVSMVGVGEQSGRLPEVLENISDVYEDQVEGSIMVATSLFEPIMICVFGAIVLVLVLAIYMPIFMMGAASAR